jgi:xylulokinase
MRESEAAGLGAALLAGMGAGIWRSAEEAMACVVRTDRVFEPRSKYRRFYQLQKEIYQELYQRTAELSSQWAALNEILEEHSERTKL